MTEEKKRGRGRPKGAPNKPKMELDTKQVRLTNDANVFEILCQTEIVLQDNEAFAINGLRTFSDRNGAVLPVLQWLFDSKINSTLPEGKTPYGENQAPASDLAETSLRFEFKKFKYFVTNDIPQLRRESMWIQLLEGIPSKEAELIDLVKEGINPFKYITKEFVVKAFPKTNLN